MQIHSGNWTVPQQIIIRSPKGTNNLLNLPHGTSLLDLKASYAENKVTEPQNGLTIYTLPEALIECSPQCYVKDSIDMRTCLNTIQEPSELLAILMEKGQFTKAERLAGAFRNVGKEVVADAIVDRMKRLGYDIREQDPFEPILHLLLRR